MILPAVLFYFIFRYVPIYGLTLAFKDYKFNLGIMGSPWAGLEVFKEVFREKMFWLSMRNTLWLNLLSLIVGFPMPILFALMLNELKAPATSACAVHSLPAAFCVMGDFLRQYPCPYGPNTCLFNSLLNNQGHRNHFLTERGRGCDLAHFQQLEGVGWQANMYLSSLSGIDQLYEAAAIDGDAAPEKRYPHHAAVNRSTIVIILILQIGRI
jgi:putative aldouronate transport system permease protein